MRQSHETVSYNTGTHMSLRYKSHETVSYNIYYIVWDSHVIETYKSHETVLYNTETHMSLRHMSHETISYNTYSNLHFLDIHLKPPIPPIPSLLANLPPSSSLFLAHRHGPQSIGVVVVIGDLGDWIWPKHRVVDIILIFGGFN